MAGLGSFVHGRVTHSPVVADNAAPSGMLGPTQFKADLPKTRLGKHAFHTPNKSTLRAQARQQDTSCTIIQRPDLYGTDAGGIDTTTNLTINPVAPQDDSQDGSQEAGEPWSDAGDDDEQEDEGVMEGEDDGALAEDWHGANDEIITWKHRNETRSISRSENPAGYEEVFRQLASEQRGAFANVQSYPPTTSGEPSELAYEGDLLHPNLTLASRHAPHVAEIQDPMLQLNRRGAAHKDQDHPPAQQYHPSSRYNQGGPVDISVQSRPLAKHTKQPALSAAPVARPPSARTFRDRGQIAQRGELRRPATPKNQPLAEDLSVAETTLDYDRKALEEKSLIELQNEDYDVDPRSALESIHKLSASELCDQLVQHSRDQDDKDQRDFFASLNIDQWEQAGEWFQKRFAEMFNKFSKQRREKRKASCVFEQEIAHRNEAVSKKRKITEDALVAMRGAGQNVLETPKKQKQKRQQ